MKNTSIQFTLIVEEVLCTCGLKVSNFVLDKKSKDNEAVPSLKYPEHKI